VDLDIHQGELIAIQGPSGSGKTTLFYLLGLLARPSQGSLFMNQTDTLSLNDSEQALFRSQNIGFVFQHFHLLPHLNGLENILLAHQYPIEIAFTDRTEKAYALADQLDILDCLKKKPHQLSGGQQQRIAIARALLKDAPLLLADEPTGALDSRNAQNIMQIFSDLNQAGKTIALITHDDQIARQCQRTLQFKDGKVLNTPKLPFSPIKTPFSAVMIPRLNQLLRIFPLAWENVLLNKKKSLLTMLGIFIGVCGLLVTITLGRFAQKKVLESYESLGVNKIFVSGQPNWELKASDKKSKLFFGFDSKKEFGDLIFLFDWIENISALLKNTNMTARCETGQIENQITLLGVNNQYLKITNRKLLKGKNFSFIHMKNANMVCVIGYDVSERLFQKKHLLGQFIWISSDLQTLECKVIGILEKKIANDANPNLDVLIPENTFINSANTFWNKKVWSFNIKAKEGSSMEKASLQIKNYFSRRYHQGGNFTVGTDATLIFEMKKLFRVFTFLIASLSLLCLFVGAIGITNMMLINLNEQFKVIGIKKAIGATHQTLFYQLLMESTLLCSMAGISGVIFGIGLTQALIGIATRFFSQFAFAFTIDGLAISLSFIAIAIVSLFSGLLPAYKAKKMSVVEAIRSE
jgi:macrolide transport system ATP-binding/permease protein